MDNNAEWLEADGLGGFASGTVSGIRTRRYHALLLTATTPPTGRVALVNGFEAWVETAGGKYPITSQAYFPNIIHPDGAQRIQRFVSEPWPHWEFHIGTDIRIEQEIFVLHDAPVVVISWRLVSPKCQAILCARPLLSGRDYHALHRENPAFRFDAELSCNRVAWHPYDCHPQITAISSGEYLHEPVWYRNFLYQREKARGLDFIEDLASPGIFRWDLSAGEAAWILTTEGRDSTRFPTYAPARALLRNFQDAERKRREQFPSSLHRAADAYIVRRGAGKSIVAGYPWFTDWGRDTFISMRGLCLTTKRFQNALEILLKWAGTVSNGMLPNRFPDKGEEPEFNSVDASLWFIIAVHDFLRITKAMSWKVSKEDEEALGRAVEAILTGYGKGTRYGIHLDKDGLLAAGQPGVQLTWMDARSEGREVTPRIGKPVEIQALWLNALCIGSQFSDHWHVIFERGLESFRSRFWNEKEGCLYDVIDCDHQIGKVDAAFRPNQIFAVGGLPLAVLEGNHARKMVDAVEKHLWTPMGLRSLGPHEPGYAPHYEGSASQRDAAYHQGTVWPWLLGAFVEAWIRVRAGTPEAKHEAGQFLYPHLSKLLENGCNHIPEIADGDPPHAPRGCPFQAWSLGEVFRLSLDILAE